MRNGCGTGEPSMRGRQVEAHLLPLACIEDPDYAPSVFQTQAAREREKNPSLSDDAAHELALSQHWLMKPISRTFSDMRVIVDKNLPLPALHIQSHDLGRVYRTVSHWLGTRIFLQMMLCLNPFVVGIMVARTYTDEIYNKVPVVICKLCGAYLQRDDDFEPRGIACRTCAGSVEDSVIGKGKIADMRRNLLAVQATDGYKVAEVQEFTCSVVVAGENALADASMFTAQEIACLQDRLRVALQDKAIFRLWVTLMYLLGPGSDALLLPKRLSVVQCYRCFLGGFLRNASHCVLCRRAAAHATPDAHRFNVPTHAMSLGEWVNACRTVDERLARRESLHSLEIEHENRFPATTPIRVPRHDSDCVTPSTSGENTGDEGEEDSSLNDPMSPY